MFYPISLILPLFIVLAFLAAGFKIVNPIGLIVILLMFYLGVKTGIAYLIKLKDTE